MKKFLQTHIKTIVISCLFLLLAFMFIHKNFIKKDNITYKEQAIERINLDSLKNKMYEQIKDSVHTADSIYLQSLSKMSKTELQSEFNKKFPK